MKAIILAAGIGSRLQPITNDTPKTMVQVNGNPIISHILDSLLKNNITDIVICVGFKADQIIAFCKKKYPDLNITFVINRDFLTTNNMYSLYLARKHLNDDIILMNGDLVYSPLIIKELKKSTKTSVAVDTTVYYKESMKIIINEKGEINRISKKIPSNISCGCSIDIYHIIKSDMFSVKNRIKYIIEKEKNLNQWTEVMLDDLFSKGKITAYPCNISGKKWIEIDNFNDLANAEVLFNKKLHHLNKKKIFFIDRDGTLTLGNKIIDGAIELLNKLKTNGYYFYIVSNNSSKTPSGHLETFVKLGLNISLDNILISTQSASAYLLEKKCTNIFWVANKNVSNYLKNNGFVFNDKNPAAILLTYDTEITYAKLTKLIGFVRQDIPYYVTHSDILCPTPDGDLPDIGTFIEMIKTTTGRVPDKIFGKPDKMLFDLILKKHNLTYNDAVVVGDRLYTDIKLAENSKIISILVLSGETTRNSYEKSNIRADIVVDSVKSLLKFI